MSVKLLTEQHFEFLSLKGGYTGWSESTLVKMPHCWKSHVAAHLIYFSYENACCEVLIGSIIVSLRRFQLVLTQHVFLKKKIRILGL